MQASGFRVRDLGELVGDVLLFGGPYSNLQASEAMLAIARDRAIAASNRICTGDIVAYCANPNECVQLWRDECALVAGNCEHALAERARDCGCGFEVGSACDALSRGWYPFANSALSDDARACLAGAPDVLVFLHRGRRYAVIHGGLDNVARYLWSNSSDAEFAREIDSIRGAVGVVDCVVAGHSGIAFQRRVDGVDWVNAGAIGMPENDGRTDTQFAVLGDGGIRVQRLAYDHAAASAAMAQAGLNQGYERSLLTGYWPSQDILPNALRR